MKETKQRVVILPAGTGYWNTRLFPIGGDFCRTVFDVTVTVEREFKNYHGVTASGRIVATNMPIAFPLSLCRPVCDECGQHAGEFLIIVQHIPCIESRPWCKACVERIGLEPIAKECGHLVSADCEHSPRAIASGAL